MTVSLGNIILDDDLRLDGVRNQSKLAISVRPTFGAPVAQRCARSGGDTLTLVASSDNDSVMGMFTGAQLDQIVGLRDIGEPVTLVHHLGTFTVMIPATALDAVESFEGHVNPDADEWHIGSIPLITV